MRTMKNDQTRSARRIRSFVVTLLGFMLAAVPLALWVAWSQEIFWGVLAASGAFAALWILLVEVQGVPNEGRSPSDVVGKRAELSDEFVAEVHRIFPLNYHHSRIAKGRFRRAMEKMQTLMPR